MFEEKKLLGGIIAGRYYPKDMTVDFYGFGRDNLEIDGKKSDIKKIGNLSFNCTENAVVSEIETIGTWSFCDSKNGKIGNAKEVKFRAFIRSDNGTLYNVEKLEDESFYYSKKGTAYNVEKTGKNSFVSANDIVVYAGSIEGISGMKSGIVIAEEIGKIEIKDFDPKKIKIYAASVLEGKDFANTIKKERLNLQINEGENIREKILEFAKRLG